MTIARDRAIMFAVGSLTEADLERFGVLAAVKAQADVVDIEDIDFVECSVVTTGDEFQCLATVYFTSDGEMSDELIIHIAGSLASGSPMITAASTEAALAQAA